MHNTSYDAEFGNKFRASMIHDDDALYIPVDHKIEDVMFLLGDIQ